MINDFRNDIKNTWPEHIVINTQPQDVFVGDWPQGIDKHPPWLPRDEWLEAVANVTEAIA